jgi:hypothetical protein
MELRNDIDKILDGETTVSSFTSLSAITLKYPTDIIELPGVYYQILRPLALGGVNLIEVASTYSELTLILKQDNVDDAFRLINNSLKK